MKLLPRTRPYESKSPNDYETFVFIFELETYYSHL